MRLIRRGVSLWIFFVIWALAGSASCWALEDIISTESDESIVVLEVEQGQARIESSVGLQNRSRQENLGFRERPGTLSRHDLPPSLRILVSS